ncbi:kanadaptin [Haematobia irritans]|uniref:kanadaptin n=1 Tax=Haematobia irritans TaxID=7368 RepID=UPI003F4F945E
MEEFKKPLMPVVAKIEKPTIDENEKTPSTESKEVENKVAISSPQQNCPYKVPVWSDRPSDDQIYSFEVLKSGQIIEEVKDLQSKPFWTFGRLPENDIEMAHPTISRFHAVLQYRPKKDEKSPAEEDCDDKETTDEDSSNNGPPEGWYIYDLDSTHGTFLNKQRIPSRVYIRIRVGYILRLGASTRSYILQGPVEDEEPESEMTITEIKAKRQKDLEEAAQEKARIAAEAEERERNEGCGWGMGDDADEETDLTHNPYASTNNEELFLDDPKKTLRGYFEREGMDLEYKCDEMSVGSFVCRVELPLDDENGRPIIAEVVHKGKKKECVVQCALEACRILDRHGVLRQANQEPLKRKQKSKDSDSDDEFWDRTGDVARKKQRKANATASVTLTYDDLLKQETELNQELEIIQNNIIAYQDQQKHLKLQKEKEEQGEDLDSYMENLKSKESPMDKTEIKKLRLEELRLKTELQRNHRLQKIAKPVDLPFIRNPLEVNQHDKKDKNEGKKRQLPMIGKRNQFSKFKIAKPSELPTSSVKSTKPNVNLASDEEEVEEDDDVDKNVTHNKNDTKPQIHDVFEKPVENEDHKKERETLQCDGKALELLNNEKETSGNSITESKQEEETIDSQKEEMLRTTSEDTPMTGNSQKSSTDATPSSLGESGKKRRHRIRHRGKREVDIDEEIEHESIDKYAKWVPPENQSGDGFTELNKKYGY